MCKPSPAVIALVVLVLGSLACAEPYGSDGQRYDKKAFEAWRARPCAQSL